MILEIRIIKNGTFDGLPNLVTLSMTENPFRRVERPESKSLKFLDLSSTLGKGILDPEFLNGFPNLLYLKIWCYGRHESDIVWEILISLFFLLPICNSVFHFIRKIRHKKLQAIYSNNGGERRGPTENLPSLKSYNHDDLEKIQSFVFSPAYQKERTRINEVNSLGEWIFQNCLGDVIKKFWDLMRKSFVSRWSVHSFNHFNRYINPLNILLMWKFDQNILKIL